eukprot:3669080-Pyramimonas_sp.AAC.1
MIARVAPIPNLQVIHGDGGDESGYSPPGSICTWSSPVWHRSSDGPRQLRDLWGEADARESAAVLPIPQV